MFTQLRRDERRRGFSLARQARAIAPLAALWLVGFGVLITAQAQTAAPLRELFLDPTTITGAPWYTGALSSLGIFVWTLGVAFAAAGAWVARRTGRHDAARFLTAGTIATLIMVLDDIFKFHSSVLNDVVWIPRAGAQFLIVAPTMYWVLRYLDDLLRTRFFILFAGLACFAGSLVIDQSGFLRGDTALLVEDGFKFMGILAWCQYFVLTARDIAASAIASHTASIHSSDSDGSSPDVSDGDDVEASVDRPDAEVHNILGEAA